MGTEYYLPLYIRTFMYMCTMTIHACVQTLVALGSGWVQRGSAVVYA